MLHALMFLPTALLPALGRRVAGGAFQQWTGINVGDYPARAFYGLTVWALAVLVGAPALHALMLILAVFLGCAVPNFGGIAMGRSGNPPMRDALAMFGHGVLSLVLVALAFSLPATLHGDMPSFLAALNWRPAACIVAAGAACPLAYGIGWDVSGLSGNVRMPLGLRGGSEIGEALWGLLIGFGVIAALMEASKCCP